MNMHKILTVLMLAAVAVGCSSNPSTRPAANNGVPKPLTIDDRILAAAESVSASVRELALIEASKAPKLSKASNTAPAGLDARLNVNWSGPVGQFMQSAAALSKGYTFKIRGKEPAIPVIVTINDKNVSLYDLIRNAALQCGNRANITIDQSDEDNKVIILEYPA